MVYIYCPSFLLDIDNNKIPLLSFVQIHATILQYVGREGEVLSYPDRAIYQSGGRNLVSGGGLEISYQCSSGGRVSGAAAQP